MAQGTIDSLNFEVLLEDKGFEAKLKRLEEVAQKFNVSMSQALTISKVTSFNTGIRQTNTQLTNTANILRTISQLTGVAFGAMGIRRFLSTLVDVTGQFEVQKMALGSMLQDADKADKIFGQFRQLALESPYTFQEFTKFGKQLTAFNIPAEQLVDTTKMLADVAAGLGVDMQRIILAYGQIKSAGVLKGTELRQLTEAGVPILDELAKQIERTTGKTVQLAEVFDMISKKQIPFAMVEQAFRDMTSEGGKFYNMQEVLVETLAGKIGKLRDTWQQALYDIGSAQSGLLKGSVDFLTALVSNYDKLGRVILTAAGALGVYKTASTIATLAAQGYTIANQAEMLAILATEKAQRLLNATILKNPYVIAGAALVTLTAIVVKHATAASELAKSQQILKQTTDEYEGTLRSEQEELRILLERMELLNPANETYIELKERLINKYGQYLSDIDKENIAIGNLTGVYDKLALSIEKTAMARAKDEGMSRLQDQFTATIQDITKTFNKKYGNTIKSSEERKNLLDFIFGRIDESQLVEGVKNYAVRTGFQNPILNLRDRYREAKEAVEEGNKELEEAYGKTAEIVKNNNVLTNPTEWQKTVGYAIGSNDALWNLYGYKNEENWETYYTRMEGEYKKNNNNLLHATNEADRELYKSRKEFLEKLNDEFGGGLLATSSLYNKSSRQEETEAEKKRKAEIKDIKDQINLLKKYKETYDALLDIVGEDDAKALTQKIYKDVNISDYDFTSQIVDLTVALRGLGDAAGADSILTALGLGEGKDTIKGLQQAQRTADSYKELIRAMTTEDTDVEGKGFWYDISKVASDLETKLNKLALQGRKAKEKLAGLDVNDENQKAAIYKALADEGWTDKEISDFWDKWVVGGRQAIDDFIADASKKAEAAARERAEGLGKTYVEEEFFTRGIDFDNISDKTIGQLRSLKQKLFDILSGLEIKQTDKDILAAYGIDINNLKDINLDELFKTLESERMIVLDDSTKNLLRLMQAAQGAKISFEDLSGAISKIIKGRLADLGEEEKKALLQYGRFAVDSIRSVMDALAELSDTAGDGGLALLAEDLSEIAGLVESAMKGFQQGDVAGAVTAAISYIATGMIKAATETARFKRELAEAREEARKLKLEETLTAGVDTIFGTNSNKKVSNAVGNIKEITKAMQDAMDDIPKEFQVKKNFWQRALKGGFSLVGMAIGSQINKYTEYSLKEMADSLGGDLYDQYGNLNAVTLQAILDTYDNLKQSDKDWIQSAIYNSKAYTKAMEQLDSVIEDVMGDLATSAASAIVDQWKAAGDAALDYADILDDVATKYAEMAVESLLLDDVFDDDMRNRLREAFRTGEMDEAMQIVAESMEAVAAMAPQIEQVLEPLRPYIKQAEESDTGNTSKAGINKELVEGNSSLIASYMNAMRADLSVVRSMQASGWQDVRVIRETMEGQYAPNYNEYMAQIAANTYDTARSNDEILARLKSVIMASPSGGSAVRTAK